MNRRITPKDTQRLIHHHIGDAIENVKVGYSLEEQMQNFRISVHVQDISKQLWKGGKTQFMKIFKKECQLLMKHKVIDLKELGFLTYAGVMFTEFEDNALKNDDGTFASQKDIAEALDMKKPTVNSIMRPLVEKNLIFEKPNPDNLKAKAYFLNPFVFFKGSMIDRIQKEILLEMEESLLKSWKNADKVVKDNLTESDVLDAAKDELEINSKLLAEKKMAEVEEQFEGNLVRGIREEETAENLF